MGEIAINPILRVTMASTYQKIYVSSRLVLYRRSSPAGHRLTNYAVLLGYVHIPDEIVRGFRRKESTHSDSNRPLIPEERIHNSDSNRPLGIFNLPASLRSVLVDAFLRNRWTLSSGFSGFFQRNTQLRYRHIDLPKIAIAEQGFQ
jgi:hypothetical protein